MTVLTNPTAGLYPKFVASYQGESEYEVKGVRYLIRTHAFDYHSFKQDHFESSVLPLVGTVTRSWGRDEFPPDDVVSLFPGFIPARWVKGTPNSYEFKGTPKTRRESFGTVADID